jgi:hypothetical protein
MKKVYEVTFDVVGGGTLHIEAESASQAYDIACRQDIDVNDYVEGIEIVPPVEDDVVDEDEYEQEDVIRER